MGFPTPNSVPDTTTCRTIQIPDDPLWFAIVNGALSELLDIRNFEQYGTLTPQETVNAFAVMFHDYLESDCSTPTPITPIVLDDYDRTDAGTLGSNWTADPTMYGNAMFGISSNQAISTTTTNQAYWNVETFGPNSEVFAQIMALGEAQSAGFNLCIINPVTSTASGYAVVITLNSAVYTVDIYRADNRSFSLIQTISPVTFDDGNWLLAKKVGDTITIQVSTDGTSWSDAGTVDDATYDTGYIGIYSGVPSGSPVLIDNFGGGTLP